MEDKKAAKTIVRKKTVIMKDGTIREYSYVGTYRVKGKINPDGSVSKFSIEQKQEIKRLYNLGVPVAKIARDYDTTRVTVTKIVNE